MDAYADEGTYDKKDEESELTLKDSHIFNYNCKLLFSKKRNVPTPLMFNTLQSFSSSKSILDGSFSRCFSIFLFHSIASRSRHCSKHLSEWS